MAGLGWVLQLLSIDVCLCSSQRLQHLYWTLPVSSGARFHTSRNHSSRRRVIARAAALGACAGHRRLVSRLWPLGMHATYRAGGDRYPPDHRCSGSLCDQCQWMSSTMIARGLRTEGAQELTTGLRAVRRGGAGVAASKGTGLTFQTAG